MYALKRQCQDSLIVVDRLSKYALKRQCLDSLIVVDRLSKYVCFKETVSGLFDCGGSAE